MMKFNNSTIKRWIALLCSVLGIFLFGALLKLVTSILLSDVSVSKFLEGVPVEDEQIPSYVEFSTVHIDKSAINLQTTLLANGVDIDSSDINEVLYIDKERIWFTYEEILNASDDLCWVIASVNRDGEDFIKHHGEVFESANNAKLYQCGNNLNGSYFQYKNGFYYNGSIILTDHQKLIEYNIETGYVSSMLASEYVYPSCNADVITYDDELCLILSDNNFQISTSTMAQSSLVHATIMEKFGDGSTWSGRPLIEDYFYGVQTNGEDYYVVCNIMNWSGETYALVYSFDHDENSYSFCFSQYIGDKIHDGDFYIIPEYSQ